MARFSDIVGQKQIIEHFQNVIRTGNASHAYIIEGEKDSGKEFIARIFAKTLLCEDQKTEGDVIECCDTCHSCIQANNLDHPDIITVTHEKPASIGVDDIRTQIRDSVIIKPYQSDYKIYIVPECEKMTVQAQNALLKTLEEPPQYAIIILLTTNAGLFLQTVISRCVVLPMKAASDDLIRDFLKEKCHVPDYKAELCASFARGNVGRAMELSGNSGFEQLKDDIAEFLMKMNGYEIHRLNSEIKDILTRFVGDEKPSKTLDKTACAEFIDVCGVYIRDIAVYKTIQNPDYLIFKDKLSYISDISERCSYEGIGKILDSAATAIRRINANVNSEIAMELLLLDMKTEM